MLSFFQINGFKKKLFLGFKHIRLKSSDHSQLLTEIRPKEAIKHRISELSEILDCTTYTATKIVTHNSIILSLAHEVFLRNAKFCSKHLKFSDVIECPGILSFNSSLLQHRYFSLMELGCCNVTALDIIKFQKILKLTPKALRREGIIFNVDNFLDTFLCLIDAENKDSVESRLRKLYHDGSSLRDIKAMMNTEFLVSKLSCSLFKAHLLFKKYPPLRVNSILNTNQLLDVLFENFGLPSSKVIFAPSLLSMHHEIALQFLKDIPTILGVSTVQLFHKFPMILKRPVSALRKIDSILKDYDISNSQLLCCPKVINFTPAAIKQRLETLCASEDFSPMKSSTKFLWLVYHYKNLDPRLILLKSHNIPPSINMFIVSKSNFDRYLTASQCRTLIKDTCFYLSRVFDCTEREIHLKLKEYPNLHGSSLVNSSRIVDFLLKSNVSKEQILNGIGIIFYDYDVVKMYFHEIQNHSDCQPFSDWVNHYNLIQLLIYKIEVEAGFRGTTLYKIRGNPNESDEVGVESLASPCLR